MKNLFSILKRKKRRVPSARMNSRSVVSFLFWMGVLAILFITTQSYLRTAFLNEKVNGYQDSTEQELEKMVDEGFITSPAGEAYTEEFVKSFINIPVTEEERKKRSEDLSRYLAEGLTLQDIENNTNFKGERKLTSISLHERRGKGESAYYTYNVSYETLKTPPLLKKGEKKISVTPLAKKVMITVLVGTDGQNFNVIEQPYFSNVPNDTRLSAVKNGEDDSKKNLKQEDELKRFATQFFTSYTENTVSEMSYLMETPESLKDLYQYRGVENFKVYDSEKNTYLIKTLVLLEDGETGIVTKQPFSILVEKKQNKFYVKKLLHSIGG
ncbi:conjugal transfer protein [Fictibacillus nanhaiensis]|uniref:conjugal transfer protein n=1 Tax=Fictibacillus nanhaiensis TaxID=742169 RepID=UPI002E1DDB4C|nr:conjugal transfer protein [Fictibacillus nanhaiensis]